MFFFDKKAKCTVTIIDTDITQARNLRNQLIMHPGHIAGTMESAEGDLAFREFF